MTIITIVIIAFGNVTKGLLKGLGDLEVGERVEIIQITIVISVFGTVVKAWKLKWKS